MNQKELEKILPHRKPMLLLDFAQKDGELALANVTIKGDEWFLQGHFPGNPVVPGVILCEMLAQACCVLVAGESEGATPYFTGIQKARFKSKVLPGDRLDIECRITRAKPPFFFAEGSGSVNGKSCVTAEISFMLDPGK